MEKQQIPILYSLIWPSQVSNPWSITLEAKHDNRYTIEVMILLLKIRRQTFITQNPFTFLALKLHNQITREEYSILYKSVLHFSLYIYLIFNPQAYNFKDQADYFLLWIAKVNFICLHEIEINLNLWKRN